MSGPKQHEAAVRNMPVESILAESECALPAGYQDEIEACLAAQLEDGGTLYGRRQDGAYVARTKSADRVILRTVDDS